MFNAGLRVHRLAVLLLVFLVQWKQCASTAEDFASDGSSVGDDYISYNQQRFSTEKAPARATLNYLDSYDQEDEKETEAGKESQIDALEDVAGTISNKEKIAQKPFKDIEDGIIYGATGGDITLKGFNDGQWNEDSKESTPAANPAALKTTMNATSATTAASVKTTSKSIGLEDADDVEDSGGRLRLLRSRPNNNKEWATNRKRKVHSAFEKHKAYHRNYHRFSHKGHKKAFSRYKKYEHHRSKHKSVRPHHHQHPQHSHVQHPVFDEQPYYQGQVSYYDQDDDTADITSRGRIDDDKSLHLPAEMRSYQRYGQFRRGEGSYQSDAYSNRGVKWPHLQRIEYQITEDERRERVVDDYGEQLPPYIRKYNRRNKQLLDLLEGTMLPSTSTTAAPHAIPAKVQYSDYIVDSSREIPMSKKYDEIYRKGGHSHFHNHRNPKWIVEDLFEEQRDNPNNPNVEDDQYLNDSVMPSKSPKNTEVNGNSHSGYTIRIKGKDFSDEDDNSDENITKDIGNENMILMQQNEFPRGSVVDNLMSHDENAGAGRKTVQPNLLYPPSDTSASHSKPISYADAPGPGAGASPTEELKISPKANQFIYHRVASSRSLGTGTKIIGVDGGSRKQRLPFVAITDRRLETSKMQKQPTDFQQNHLPLP